MPSVTDWLMVAITAIYVIATILIYRSNNKAVQTAQEQIEESKRQFAETQRLQVMPYLQLELTDGKINENGDPVCPYTIFEISSADKANMIRATYFLKLLNVGVGMLHHSKVQWNSLSKHDDGYPAEDIVIPPGISWETNVLFTAAKNESEDPLKQKTAKCTINVDFEDLLGNKYNQKANLIFLISHKDIRLIHYHLKCPCLKEI